MWNIAKLTFKKKCDKIILGTICSKNSKTFGKKLK